MIDLQGLVAEFARHVQAETEAAWRGDSKTANKHVDQYLAVFDKLRAHGGTGRDALAVLFTHPRMDVRVSAAALLLRHRTAEAKAVLEEAAKGKGLVPFEASEALKRWEEGTWALDPAGEEAGPPGAARPAPPVKRSRPRTERAAPGRRKGSKRDKPGGG
ncbi:MAG TPA: DUF2019 domain-containing protein [Archangium sp.]|uniref:DUF2019 domain-containing protein n=1 Tax=Archangium sp. TaxID=1872627 RepID=UPI002E35B7B6|nr:DUF2019 domain-containing protein [Archangium sp.]HEX5744604.1 DUF2019 domain-containing protein [Archangium sp.]